MTSGREKIIQKTERTEIPVEVTEVWRRVWQKINEASLVRARSIRGQQQ